MKKIKTISVLRNIEHSSLSTIATQLKGKELFPNKVEKAKQFFNHLHKTRE